MVRRFSSSLFTLILFWVTNVARALEVAITGGTRILNGNGYKSHNCEGCRLLCGTSRLKRPYEVARLCP